MERCTLLTTHLLIGICVGVGIKASHAGQEVLQEKWNSMTF